MDRKLELKRTRTLRKQTGQIDNLLKSHLMRMRPWLNGNKEALEFKFHHVWEWFRYSGLPVRVQLVIRCLTRKLEEEYEMILKRTLQSICLLTINPNTTTSIIIQVIDDDGALLSCAINAACVALVDAGIPTEHLAVAICCCVAKSGCVILDPTRLEEQIIIEFPLLIYYIHDTWCRKL
ncbi:exosome complex exonuclease RRP46 homolog isoform X1 [Gossypium hirsutum]|uniref:Exosome complex exonuclease RRP46 homolog isoform X1 n=1 Tax=Gossypium hirsutum TaxID=3635 RepID=A0A1U8J4F1_GOSHI|nr:exosome complex exonuclease RRP46 homolog isoform X1 [Gossypium hirsutum]